MSDLCMGWAEVRLADIAEVRLGRQRSPKNHSGTHMRPYLRAANVDWNGLKLSDVKTMNFTDEEAEVYRLQAGDIVLGEASGSPSEVGKPALWNAEIDDCCFQNTLLRVRSYGVDRRFLLHYLRYEAVRGAFAERSHGVGIHHLGAERLANWPIRLPPLDEQGRIVATLEDHLSRLEHAESTLSGIAVRLSSLYRAILKEKFRNISLGSVSCTRKLGDVAIIASGQTPAGISEYLSAEPGVDYVPFYKVGDMNHSDGRFMSSSRTYIHRDDAARIGLKIRPAGTILIPKRGGAIATNKKRILRTPSAYDLNTMGIIPSREVDSTYLWRWFEQINLAELSDGSNVPQLNNPDLINLEISVPDLMVQQGLTGELDILTTGATRLLRTVNEIRKSPLRPMLLKEAFSGQLVPQDPADEPIAVLLKRIHAEQVTQARPRRRRRAANPTLQKETQL